MKRTFKKLILFSALALVMAFQLAIPVFAKTETLNWTAGDYSYVMAMTIPDEKTLTAYIIPGTTVYHSKGSETKLEIKGPETIVFANSAILSQWAAKVSELAKQMELISSVTKTLRDDFSTSEEISESRPSGNYGYGYQYYYYPVTWTIHWAMMTRATAQQSLEDGVRVKPGSEKGDFTSGPFYFRNGETGEMANGKTSELRVIYEG